ncbi:PglY protein [Amycolatopsis sp. lyj-108]|uniref:PglY protein n=1 Tax=Amycolatopsis sp. lyj-108 TaxID=2789286 RepID=UPI0039790072
MTEEVYLRDVIHMPEEVNRGDFKIDLTKGFTATDELVDNYVVTDQLRGAFTQALALIRAAVRDGNSHAAYLHGSYGSGKSHFLTVLHAVLNGNKTAREKPELRKVVAEHDEWLAGRNFLMVPFHLIGSVDLDAAILGGYVKHVQDNMPGKPVPAVFRDDAMLVDAKNLRDAVGDVKFAEMLGTEDAKPSDLDDLEPIEGAAPSAWTRLELDKAFSAQPGDPRRDALVSALLSGPMASYARGALGDKDAYLPLENGLSVISRHAQQLGYDGVVLFLDELILWLQGYLSRRDFVNVQVNKLVKLIESGDSDRPVPIISFVSRQRDLGTLIGSDIMGSEVSNLEQQVQYLAGRFDTISLEDRNLPAIVKERVLKPLPGKAHLLDSAFKNIESTKSNVKEALLDANGATHADWSDFRDVYPISPALLNVLVALSGALQRERSGLKLLQDMLHRRRADMKLGDLIPLGDLWDVIAEDATAAFTDKLRTDAEAGQRFHRRVRRYLEGKYGSTTDARFIADERLVKTLLLASLAPDVPALTRLTGQRLAALNYGSITSRTAQPGDLATTRLGDLKTEFGELRSDGDENPVFSLHLSDLDIEPLLDSANDEDNTANRRKWLRSQLWEAMGVKDTGVFVSEREIVWRGTKRTAEFVFENVRDPQSMPDFQFRPSLDGVIRFVIDYPFDEPGRSPRQDAERVEDLKQHGHAYPTLVWLPAFWSEQRFNQLGRLLKINHLLERGRLEAVAANRSAEDRIRLRTQLEVHKENLTSSLRGVLTQLYGLSRGDESNLIDPEGEPGRVLSMFPQHTPRLHVGAPFEYNMLELADSILGANYPNHPDFDPKKERKAVTVGELRTALNWITKAAEQGGRVELEKSNLALMRKIVHPLGLGEVHDGPLTLSNEWRQRIEQHAARMQVAGDYSVDDIRRWLEELDYKGLDKPVENLIISVYALLADRAWVRETIPQDAPDIGNIGPGWALRAQELPTEDEFEAARNRAGAILGVSAPAARFTRNITKLTNSVLEQVREHENAVHRLHEALHKHASELGIETSSPRVVATRAAADLLAKLFGISDSTKLIRTLAQLPDPDNDGVLARTISSAQAVLSALDAADFELLRTIRPYLDRSDGIRDRTERLMADIAETAQADEQTRQLGPMLHGFRSIALKIIQDATTAAGALPAPPPPAPAPAPAAQQTRRVTADATPAKVAETMAAVQRSVSEFAKEHPGQEIEISWRVVDGKA